MSYPYKICDPIHGFIRFGPIEKKIIDSRPFQRLRFITQMGLAYLIYPGATHTRFEHSLGVMELSTRIYNTLIAPHNRIAELKINSEEVEYWRLILRISALCHDLGHLPFSHTAEASVLPNGGHEEMTLRCIRLPEMRAIWEEISKEAERDIIKLAIGGLNGSGWARVLAQIITEDNFGADRVDYLIRDSHYTGVGYGHFDYHQLIDTLRILPVDGLTLGISSSGIQSVESLWISRYMMHARVYQHPTAWSYSLLLQRFMKKYYTEKMLADLDFYLNETDYTILAALSKAAYEGDEEAQQIIYRKGKAKERKPHIQKIGSREFPVLLENGEIVPSYVASPFLQTIPYH